MPETYKPVGTLRPVYGPPSPTPEEHMKSIASSQGVDPGLMGRLIQQESSWNPKAKSPKGAIGLTQLMPETAQRQGVDPYAPLQNIEGGTREFARLMQAYDGDYDKALAAYNAGEPRVDSGRPLPQETQNYVSKVTQGYQPPRYTPKGQLRPVGGEAPQESLLSRIGKLKVKDLIPKGAQAKIDQKATTEKPMGAQSIDDRSLIQRLVGADPNSGPTSGFIGGATDILKGMTSMPSGAMGSAVGEVPGPGFSMGTPEQMMAPVGEAIKSAKAGQYGMAAQHAAGSVPVVGGMVEDIANRIRAKDYRGAMSAGLIDLLMMGGGEELMRRLPGGGEAPKGGAPIEEAKPTQPTSKGSKRLPKEEIDTFRARAKEATKGYQPQLPLKPVEEATTTKPTPASVKMFITKAEEAELRSRGLSQEQIDKMKPQEAADFLKQPRQAPQTKIPGGVNADVPSQPINPQEIADLQAKTPGKVIRPEDVSGIRRQEAAEANVAAGLTGKKTDEVGQIREEHRAKLEKQAQAVPTKPTKKAPVPREPRNLEERLQQQVKEGRITPQEADRVRARTKPAQPAPDVSAELEAINKAKPTAKPVPMEGQLAGQVKARAGEEPSVIPTPPKEPVEASTKPLQPRKGVAGANILGQLEDRLNTVPNSNPDHIQLIKDAADKLNLPVKARYQKTLTALQAYGASLRKGAKPEEAVMDARRVLARTEPSPIGEAIGLKEREGEKGAVRYQAKASGEPGFIQNAIDRTTEARKIHSGIYDLGNMNLGDSLRFKRELEAQPKDRSDYREIYHAIEAGGIESLTPQQRNLYKQEVAPYLKENDRISTKLEKGGWREVKEHVEDYTHRIPFKKNSMIEQVLLGRRKYTPGSVLSKSASALYSRSMKAIELPDGTRAVVSVKGGKATAFLKGIPEFLGSVKSLEEAGVTFKEATTKEIQTHTNLKYLDDAYITNRLSNLELRRAERAFDTLEEIKKSPEFDNFAMKTGSTPPKGWRTTKVPNLAGYYIEPRIREVLDDYWDKTRGGDFTAFEKMNDALRMSIFMTPIRHIENIGVHWVVEKGVTGFTPEKWPMMAKNGWKAIQQVAKMGKDYQYALDHGGSLMGARKIPEQVTALLTSKLLDEMKAEPGKFQKVAEALGYGNPITMTKNFYKGVNKFLWAADDVFRMQATYDRMQRNKLPFEDAMKEVSKHIPDYRLPTRVLGSRELAKIMGNRQLSMFSSYHYSALKSYGEMIKELVGKSSTADKNMALDRLAMLGLMTFVVYDAIDKLGQSVTGTPDFKMARSGASTFIDSLAQVIKGKKDPVSAGLGVITPSPVAKSAIELISNRENYGRDFEQIRNKKAPAGEQAREVGEYAVRQLGPLEQVEHAKPNTKSRPDWNRFFWGLVGGTFPYQPSAGRGRKLSTF